MFPLAFSPATAQLQSGGALTGGIMQTISQATAKAAMFMSAGLIYAALGHDRIVGLGGLARALPVSVLAFALGGVALIGLPPSGAYLAKELLLKAAVETEQWWWAVVVQAGGVLTSSYVLLVLAHALAPADAPNALRLRVPRIAEAAALALALCSLLLGFLPWEAYLQVPHGTPAQPFDPGSNAKALWPILVGGMLAILLGRWGTRLAQVFYGKVVVAVLGPARRSALTLGSMLERADDIARQMDGSRPVSPGTGHPPRCGDAGGALSRTGWIERECGEPRQDLAGLAHGLFLMGRDSLDSAEPDIRSAQLRCHISAA
jgi:NADH:ubiquinone oxidoreductase subunit 5 (subunit L)/multisubunit Na+/H+ antiporter MnhA subunit